MSEVLKNEMKKIIIIILFFCYFGTFAQGTFEGQTVVSTKVEFKKDSLKINLWVSFDAQSNWMIYDSIANGVGPIPVSNNFTKLENVKILGKYSPVVELKHDDLFDADIYYFTRVAAYNVEFQIINTNLPCKIQGNFEYMACNLTSGVCLPPYTQDFNFVENK